MKLAEAMLPTIQRVGTEQCPSNINFVISKSTRSQTIHITLKTITCTITVELLIFVIGLQNTDIQTGRNTKSVGKASTKQVNQAEMNPRPTENFTVY